MGENYFFVLHAESVYKLKLVMTLSELLCQLVLQNKSSEAMLMSGLSYILC